MKKLEKSLRKRFGVRQKVFGRGTSADRLREIAIRKDLKSSTKSQVSRRYQGGVEIA